MVDILGPNGQPAKPRPPKRNRPKNKAEQIERLKMIYASFEVKDLTQDEFIRQMLDLSDPKKAFEDLGDIQLKKAREQLNRMRIQNAMGVSRN